MLQGSSLFIRNKRLLVYLDNDKVLVLLNDILTREGFWVTSARTIAELADCLRAEDYMSVITVSEMVAPIRKLTDLPLVDIQDLISHWEVFGAPMPIPLSDPPALLRGVCFVARWR